MLEDSTGKAKSTIVDIGKEKLRTRKRYRPSSTREYINSRTKEGFRKRVRKEK